MRNKNYDYSTDGDVSYVYLTQRNGDRHTVIINTYNLDKMLNYEYKWGVYFDPCTSSFYVTATKYIGTINGKPKYETVYLHRFLLGIIDRKIHIDHENHNMLDNRDENLRVSNHTDNNKNRKSKNSNNKSGYRNVSWIDNYWRVQLQIDGKNHMFPEKFTDVDLAGQFAEEMRQRYYGEFAGFN